MDNVKIAQALSDPTRYKILMRLMQSHTSCCAPATVDLEPIQTGLCNCEIMSELNMIQSRVSYHMKELVAAGLVNEESRGKWKYYYPNRAKLKRYIRDLARDFALE